VENRTLFIYTTDYTAVQQNEMASTQITVKDCIYRNPGIHFNAIGRQLDIATGQTQYHVRQLATQETIRTESIGGRTHYYPPTFSAWERGVIALLRRETTREIVVLLLKDDELRPDEIADRLGLARSTVEWHLSRLVEYDVVTKDRDQSALVVRLCRRTELYRLLREIEPRLINRLVDRFVRLTDELLDDA